MKRLLGKNNVKLALIALVAVGLLSGCDTKTSDTAATEASSTAAGTESTQSNATVETTTAAKDDMVQLPEAFMGAWEFVDDATYLVTLKPYEIISGDLYATYTTEYYKVVSYDETAQSAVVNVHSILSEGEETAKQVNAMVTLTLKDDVMTISYAQSEEIDATESQWVRVKK